MISFGIGNNTFDPTKEADDLATHSNNMDHWTLLVKDCASCPTGNKRKGGYIASTPRRKLRVGKTIRMSTVRQGRIVYR